jgi:hypothetical protein
LGVACLVAGLALACGGVWWIERIVSSLERPPSTLRVQGGAPT